jgi:hypothetical protein
MSTASIQPGDPIPLDAGQLDALGSQCLDLTQDLESSHATYISDVSVWWDWYNAVPDVTTRSRPWPMASNMVVPFIRSQADSLSSRAILSLFSSKRTWDMETENEFLAPRKAPITTFINNSARKPFEIFQALESSVTEQYVIGEAVFGQRWSSRQRHIVPPRGNKPITLGVGQGPEFYHRPREQWMWQRDLPLQQSEVVSEQAFMSESQIIRMGQLGDESQRWNRQSIEAASGERGIRGPVHEVRMAKLKNQGITPNQTSLLEPHDVRSLSLDWSLFSSLSKMKNLTKVTHILDQEVEDITVPAVVIFHRSTGKVFRAYYSPYLIDGWPAYELHYRKQSGQGQGSPGVAKIGEHIQRGLTTMANQSIDAVTMANALKLLTSDKKLANQPLVPNQIALVDDVNSVKELTSQKSVFPDIAIMNLLQAMGERTIGQSDPLLGRESRSGGHPSPATNFLGMLEQSQILNTRPMKSVRVALSQAGEHRATFYQQFEKNRGDWITRRFGERDAEPILEWLRSGVPAAGLADFDVHALSEIHNPQEERSKALAVDQLTTNYYIKITKFMEVLANPQAPPFIKDAARQAVEVSGLTLTKFLEASDIDEVEADVY